MKTNVMYARRIAEVGHPGDHVMTVHEGILSIVAFVPLDSRSALRVSHGRFRSSLRSRSTLPASQLRLHSSPKVGLACITLHVIQFLFGLNYITSRHCKIAKVFIFSSIVLVN